MRRVPTNPADVTELACLKDTLVVLGTSNSSHLKPVVSACPEHTGATANGTGNVQAVLDDDLKRLPEASVAETEPAAYFQQISVPSAYFTYSPSALLPFSRIDPVGTPEV
jgi:hypothetical protein